MSLSPERDTFFGNHANSLLFFVSVEVIISGELLNRRSFIMAVKIEKSTIIGDVLEIAPHAAPLFLAIGMHCLG